MKPNKKSTLFIDLSGQKFGKLLILGHIHGRKWDCVCDCGHRFEVDSTSLKRQNQRRCRFCYYRDKTKHGGSGTPEYQAWKHIKERCYDKKDRMYPNYGGRGVTVCDRWLGDNGFLNFLADVGGRPSSKHSIDRIDVDGNYEPGNCKWSTKHEQMRNRTTNVRLTYNGVTMIAADWSKKTGIPRGAIEYRLKHNWSIEKILTTPSRVKQK